MAGHCDIWYPSSLEKYSRSSTKAASTVLITLVLLHVASILAHRLFKGEDLVRPMLTGYKDSDEALEETVIVAPLLLGLYIALSAHLTSFSRRPVSSG